MKKLTLLFFLASGFGLYAQDCEQFPAPCPHDDEISDAQDADQRQANNDVLPQEMAMEGHVRQVTKATLQAVASQKGWTLYELNESTYSRPNTSIDFADWEATPYEKRPPHAFGVSYILITNKDSLQAGQNWFLKDLVAEANRVAASPTAANVSKLQKDKMDMMQRFSDASVLLVYFGVNLDLTGSGVQDNDQKYILPQKSLSITGAVYAGLLNNPMPATQDAYTVDAYDCTFNNPTHVATILFGAWKAGLDEYNQRTTSFNPSDLATVKKVKCDQAQNMVIQMEGSANAIQQALKSIDLTKLRGMIVGG